MLPACDGLWDQHGYEEPYFIGGAKKNAVSYWTVAYEDSHLDVPLSFKAPKVFGCAIYLRIFKILRPVQASWCSYILFPYQIVYCTQLRICTKSSC